MRGPLFVPAGTVDNSPPLPAVGPATGRQRRPGWDERLSAGSRLVVECGLGVERGAGFEPLSSLAGLRSVERRIPHR